MLKKIWKKLQAWRLYEFILLVGMVVVSFMAHYRNMFNYPYYENDEGVYISQAWSIINQGELAPYTYWYDHAPAGWIFLSFWFRAVGSFFAFGSSVDTGRVFILILHVISTALVFLISKKITRNVWGGVIATIIFSLSPVGIYFQRRVLLDNIMVFWTLISLWYLVKPKIKLMDVMLNAVFLGIAALTKEVAIFFIPGILYLIWKRLAPNQKRFGLFSWVILFGSIIGIYIVYAILKGELFVSENRVSLLGTLKQQAARTGGKIFWDYNSVFLLTIRDWIKRDVLMTFLAFFVPVVSLVIGQIRKNIYAVSFSLMLLGYIFFLIRGGVVLDFYILPIIPFVGILSAYLISEIVNYITFLSLDSTFNKTFVSSYFWFSRVFLYFGISVILIVVNVVLLADRRAYTVDENLPQREIVKWIKSNLSTQAVISVDNSIWVDLRDGKTTNEPRFKNTEWSWKIEKDAAVYKSKLNNDWQNINYIGVSHEMYRQIRLGLSTIQRQAVENSFLVKDWSDDSSSYIDRQSFLSTNGDWMSLYQVKNRDKIILDNLWNNYKQNFVVSYGQVLDQELKITTSEAQSYGLLRAAWSEDKKMFEGIYSWTTDHFQHRADDKLFSWKWGKTGDNKEEKVVDPMNATDADLDVALSLLIAGEKWQNPKYIKAAKEIINDIWSKCVINSNDQLFLLPSVDAKQENKTLILNPSYFSPAHYRYFAKYDTQHNWEKLATDSYAQLEQMAGGENKLIPNWIKYNLVTKKYEDLNSNDKIKGNNLNDYGYDAFRIFWRTGLDYHWNRNPDSLKFLKKYSSFFEKQIKENNGKVSNLYTTKGEKLSEISDMSTNAGVYLALKYSDSPEAANFWKVNFIDKLDTKQYKFEGGDNYYNQNWSWFVYALEKGFVRVR